MIKKNTGFDAPFLDDEEKKLIEQAEQGTQSTELAQNGTLQKWSKAADKTSKRKPMTIRVQERDVMRIKRIASRHGIPYQTLISSVIHRIASGELELESKVQHD